MKVRKLSRALLAPALAASLALAPQALAARASAGKAATGTPPPAKFPASATVEECMTSAQQTERSVTFAGEMTAQRGATKMEMRVDVLERLPKDLVFHSVFAP
ncbi:MAG: hypothetical protein ACYDC2_10050, partial [Solirubrobacteraceae bacterium]